MRALDEKEIKKRGCKFCRDFTMTKPREGYTKIYAKRKRCIYDVCPYHVLDKYDTYRDYLKHEAPKLNLEKLLGLGRENVKQDK